MGARLEGKVAVITGGASGIGEATVRRFVDEGARVVVSDIQDERGQDLASDLGAAVRYQRTDVTAEADVAGVVDFAVSEFGKLDFMFNNAGIVGAVGPIDETPVEEYDASMAILLRGPFLGTKHAARVMKPRGTGSILSTSSIAGLMGGLGPHAYAMAKTALIGLTRNAAAELGKYNIRVNCVAPGNMATQMISALGGSEDIDNLDPVIAMLAQTSPIKGRAGRAEDIANAALFLASDEAGYVNGHTMAVDGGLTIGGGNPSGFSERQPMIREAGRRGL